MLRFAAYSTRVLSPANRARRASQSTDWPFLFGEISAGGPCLFAITAGGPFPFPITDSFTCWRRGDAQEQSVYAHPSIYCKPYSRRSSKTSNTLPVFTSYLPLLGLVREITCRSNSHECGQPEVGSRTEAADRRRPGGESSSLRLPGSSPLQFPLSSQARVILQYEKTASLHFTLNQDPDDSLRGRFPSVRPSNTDWSICLRPASAVFPSPVATTRDTKPPFGEQATLFSLGFVKGGLVWRG